MAFLKECPGSDLNTVFYNNVPGGDYIYFISEVADQLKKNGSSPQLTMDQIMALKLADGSLVKFGKHGFSGYFG